VPKESQIRGHSVGIDGQASGVSAVSVQPRPANTDNNTGYTLGGEGWAMQYHKRYSLCVESAVRDIASKGRAWAHLRLAQTRPVHRLASPTSRHSNRHVRSNHALCSDPLPRYAPPRHRSCPPIQSLLAGGGRSGAVYSVAWPGADSTLLCRRALRRRVLTRQCPARLMVVSLAANIMTTLHGSM